MLIIVFRTLILYLTVIFSFRLMGKRQIGELQPSELVVAIMISDLASVPMQTIDIPLLAGIVPVFTLIIAEIIMSYLSLKFKWFRKVIAGEPSIIIYNGEIKEKELERLRYNINDLLEELRINSCHNISDVLVAVLETNGQLTVIPKKHKRAVTVEDLKIKNPENDGLPFVVISDGTINTSELSRSGKSVEELKSILKKHNIDTPKEVFLASIDAENNVFIQKKDKYKKNEGEIEK